MEGRGYLDLDAWIMGISIEALRFVARLADGVCLCSNPYDVLQAGKLDLLNDDEEAAARQSYASHLSTPTFHLHGTFEELSCPMADLPTRRIRRGKTCGCFRRSRVAD
jgi:hypothetical protein